MNEKDHSTRNAVIVSLIVLAVLMLLVPLAIGQGKAIAFGTSEDVLANAEYQLAVGEASTGKAALALAEAERYRGISDALATAPDALSAAGGTMLNAGLAILLVLAGSGLAYLVYSLGYTVKTYADITRTAREANVQVLLFNEGVTNPNILPTGRGVSRLPSGNIIGGKSTDLSERKATPPHRANRGTGRIRPSSHGVNNKPTSFRPIHIREGKIVPNSEQDDYIDSLIANGGSF